MGIGYYDPLAWRRRTGLVSAEASDSPGFEVSKPGDLVKQAFLIRFAREILLPLSILLAFAILAGFLPERKTSTQPFLIVQHDSPAAIDQDPHFRRLLANDHVRVFALTLAPNSESFVRYEHNFITIAPEDNEVIMWREGQSAVQHYRVPRGEIHFFLGQAAHGLRNDARSGDYHNVTVEFLDSGVTTYGYRYYQGKWDYGPSILNPPVDAAGHFVNSLDLGRAVASDIQLLPREFLPASKRLQLVVAVSALDLQMGKRKLRLEPGEVLWLEGREAELVNAGNDAARFALIELKTANEQY
jgi:hypothetical protein